MKLTSALSTRPVLSISASMSRGSRAMSWFTCMCGLMMTDVAFALCVSSLYTYFLRGLRVVHCSLLTRRPVPAGKTNHAMSRLHRSRMKALRHQGSSACSTRYFRTLISAWVPTLCERLRICLPSSVMQPCQRPGLQQDMRILRTQ